MNKVQEQISNIMNIVPSINSWDRRNCPVCTSMGQPRPDMRGRGNYLFNSDGSFAYNCFNCHVKVGWSPGGNISEKFETVLKCFGATDYQIMQLKVFSKEIAIDCISDDKKTSNIVEKTIHQNTKQYSLPNKARRITDWITDEEIPKQLVKVLQGINKRNPYLFDLELYWTPETFLENHFIIPYYSNNKLIGYSARHYNMFETEDRYRKYVSTNVLYNFDLLNDARVKKIFVFEGEIDASLMSGVSTGNYYLTNKQIEILNVAKEKGKQIVIVPDRDKDGLQAINQAISLGYDISLPDYGVIRTGYGMRKIKDFEESTRHFSRLYSAYLVNQSIITNNTEKQIYGNIWINS